ncbi:MAG: FG-GAP-like repeat-containing protein [Ignavibacteriota bacterium]
MAALFEMKGATPSTVTLTSSSNPSLYGRAVTLTATVTAGATGSVTFYDGAAVLGSGSVAGGSALLATPSLAAGGHRLAAYYRGDSTFAASTSAVLAHTVQAVGGNVLAAAALPASQSIYASGIGVADFKGSGKSDLLWTGLAGAGILPGNGDGTFQTPSIISWQMGASAAHAFAIADFNRDQKLDIAFGQQNPSGVAILFGNGDGSFQAGPTLNTAAIPVSVATGDFNGDGNVDLVVADWQNVNIYLGAGDGSFLPPVLCVTGAALREVAVGDFNGDGKTDLVVTDTVVDGAGGIKLLLGIVNK